ncbi:MAG: hypothetical protein KTR24_08225 [Saprospiraceae bacterium]|nr:hypothetical protein [Saprospiraceae bacterium]
MLIPVFLMATITSLCADPVVPHPLKMSVAHLTHLDSTSYEIELRIFIDDLIVGTGGKLPSRPTPWSEVAPKAKKVDTYLSSRLALSINDQSIDWNFDHMEVEEIAVACYLRFECAYLPEEITRIEATNSILVDNFVEQRNVLHIELPNSRRRSLLFNTHERSSDLLMAEK